MCVMGKLIDEMIVEGMLFDIVGLRFMVEGKWVCLCSGCISVFDGLFIEMWEVIGGYVILEVFMM